MGHGLTLINTDYKVKLISPAANEFLEIPVSLLAINSFTPKAKKYIFIRVHLPAPLNAQPI